MEDEIKIEVVANKRQTTTRVFVDGELRSERTMIREGAGVYKGDSPGDVHDDLPSYMSEVADVADEINGTDIVRWIADA